MIRVISSPSSSTTGLVTLIFAILDRALPWDGTWALERDSPAEGRYSIGGLRLEAGLR
jgi:hypothetical protein